MLSRAYASTPEQGARVSSVLAVVAALDVPIVYKAVDWWRGQHPIVFGAGKANPLAPENLMRTSGRGIFLMRSFMDDFRMRHLESGGTEVTLVKNLVSK